MQNRDGQLLFSPSDLNRFLECEHLTALDLTVARDELVRPALEDPQRELIARKGDEHEAHYLASLHGAGKTIATIELGDGSWDLERAAADTLAAMRSGVDVVYQAAFLDSAGWRGFADFLERVDTPSDLGDYSYEVADTKLARHSKPVRSMQFLRARCPPRPHGLPEPLPRLFLVLLVRLVLRGRFSVALENLRIALTVGFADVDGALKRRF